MRLVEFSWVRSGILNTLMGLMGLEIGRKTKEG